MKRKALYAIAAAVVLTGCGSKSVVQKYQDSQPAMAPYTGPVCLLPGKLPAGTQYTLLGRAIANQQGYGGFAHVNEELAKVARSVGADAVIEKQQKMKVGMWAWARPQVWGMAVRLKDPASFSCAANGGTIYQGTQVSIPQGSAPAQSYDECMARIMKISDPKLRASSMSACDAS